jgi:hypothetical protein
VSGSGLHNVEFDMPSVTNSTKRTHMVRFVEAVKRGTTSSTFCTLAMTPARPPYKQAVRPTRRKLWD